METTREAIPANTTNEIKTYQQVLAGRNLTGSASELMVRDMIGEAVAMLLDQVASRRSPPSIYVKDRQWTAKSQMSTALVGGHERVQRILPPWATERGKHPYNWLTDKPLERILGNFSDEQLPDSKTHDVFYISFSAEDKERVTLSMGRIEALPEGFNDFDVLDKLERGYLSHPYFSPKHPTTHISWLHDRERPRADGVRPIRINSPIPNDRHHLISVPEIGDVKPSLLDIIERTKSFARECVTSGRN